MTDTFPGLNDAAASNECWIIKAIRNERPELDVFSEALEVVCLDGEVKSLQPKLKREHPSDREHDRQHDDRVLDCLTEACAFAWVVWRGLGTPAFCDEEVTPDILLPDGRWIEVKAIHRSLEDDERMRRMLAGEVDSGTVSEPAPGLYGKFRSSLKDAVKKCERQGKNENTEPNVVFFNLAALDVPQMLLTDHVLDSIAEWAEEAEKALRENKTLGDVKLVMCHSYNWKAPFSVIGGVKVGHVGG